MNLHVELPEPFVRNLLGEPVLHALRNSVAAEDGELPALLGSVIRQRVEELIAPSPETLARNEEARRFVAGIFREAFPDLHEHALDEEQDELHWGDWE